MKNDKGFEPEATFGKWLMLPFAIMTFGVGLGLPVSLSIMFLDWQETFQTSRAYTAVIHSTCTGFLLGGAIIPGYMMNKFGARFTTLLGSVLASIGFVLSMFATSVEYLIVSVGIVGGLGCSFIQITSIPCITAVFDKYLSMIISTCTIFSAIVVIVFPYIYSSLVDVYSWRGTFGIVAGVILNTCVSGMIMTSTTKRKHVTPSAWIEEESLRLNEKKSELDDIGDGDGDSHTNELPIEIELDMIHGKQSHGLKLSSEDGISSILYTDTGKPTTKQRGLRSIRERIKNSDWKFLDDVVFILFFFHCALCLATVFSFPLLITDYSKSRGYDRSTGIFFFTTIFFTSIAGRIVAGLLNLSPRFHSIAIYTVFSIVNMIAMLFLSFIQDYTLTLLCLSVYGICLGAMIGLQMKCILDIQSVDRKSYPLALGLCITTEGIADFFVPIIIGYSVDTLGSYTVILIVMGCVGLISSISLGLGFRIFNKRQIQLHVDSK